MHNEKQRDLPLNDLIAGVTNFSNDQLKEDSNYFHLCSMFQIQKPMEFTFS